MIEGIFVDGLIFSIMVLGILMSYRILDFADMTCDGSVATGAAVATMCIVNGMGVTVGLIMAFLSGVLAGTVTAAIHNKLKVPGLLAGILTMTMLYSVNLRILGNKANVPLLRKATIYTAMPETFSFLPSAWAALIGTLVFVLVIKVCIDIFFRTDLGLAIGALGGNEQVVISQGMSPSLLKLIGIGLSNGLIALSGGLLAQYQGFADANLGQGMIVQGLAAIMIGEFLFSSNKISLITLRAVFGAIIYKALMFFGRKYGYLIHITPNDFKLLTGILVIASLLIAQTRTMASSSGARKKALLRSKANHEAALAAASHIVEPVSDANENQPSKMESNPTVETMNAPQDGTENERACEQHVSGASDAAEASKAEEK
ncbi:MAG: ABC transporter permease [Sphaerochaetaceae bacterium]|nr:ABC transporter permease [Sphaerochaetaceae bacterium]